MAEHTLTLKSGADYSASWIVLKGETVEELLQAARDGHIGDLMNESVKLGEAYKALANTTTALPAKGATYAPEPAQRAPQQAAPQANPNAPTCTDGPMQYRSGVKDGKPWSGYFCKARNPEHKPVWNK